MTDPNRIEGFNDKLETVLKSGRLPGESQDLELLDTARRLAEANFSTGSRLRAVTRRHLIAQHGARRRRSHVNGRALAIAVLLVVIISSLGWLIAHTRGQPAAVPPRVDLKEQVIAYQTNQDGNVEIYRMNGDGSRKTNLTRNPAEDTAPAWSPDGQWIAFLSDRSGKPEVFLMNAEGGQVRQLTEAIETTWYLPLEWSPDGGQIALTGSTVGEDENQARIYLIIIANPESSRFLNTPPAKTPRWLDNNLLIFHSFDLQEKSSLYLVDLATGSELRIVPADDSAETPSIAIISGFDSSPDGRRIAYLALQYETNPDNPNLNLPAGAVINIYDRADGQTRTLMNIQPIPNGIHSLLWSPDGSYLAYLQDEKNNGCWTVHLLRPDNPSVTALEDLCFTMRTLDPDWTPDEEWLVFPADEDGSYADHRLVALNIPSLMESPQQPLFEELTETDGTSINPQVRP